MVADPHWAAAQEVERRAGGQWDPMECGDPPLHGKNSVGTEAAVTSTAFDKPLWQASPWVQTRESRMPRLEESPSAMDKPGTFGWLPPTNHSTKALLSLSLPTIWQDSDVEDSGAKETSHLPHSHTSRPTSGYLDEGAAKD